MNNKIIANLYHNNIRQIIISLKYDVNDKFLVSTNKMKLKKNTKTMQDKFKRKKENF